MAMEDEAVAQLYREHAAALRRFVLAATSDPAQADDVVQETILRVWKLGPDVENMRGRRRPGCPRRIRPPRTRSIPCCSKW
jgi:RNA polymerase sigma-70 factor (ECF subfamily)